MGFAIGYTLIALCCFYLIRNVWAGFFLYPIANSINQCWTEPGKIHKEKVKKMELRNYYLWCKVEEKNGEQYYIQFNEQEEEIKQALLTKYFGTKIEKDLLIAEMVALGEISKEDAYDIIMEYRNLNAQGFMGFLKELEKEIGAKVVKATKFEEQFYFDEKDKPAAIAAPTHP